jgi:rhodanese-related sulfurtransferase
MFDSLVLGWIVFMMMMTPHARAAPEYVSPETVPGATTIDTARAKTLFDSGAIFVDVRNVADWEAGRIPGAVHLEIDQGLNEASLRALARPDKAVVMYCNGTKCPRSSQAAAAAVGWGFTRVFYYRLGLPDWQAAGYPVE